MSLLTFLMILNQPFHNISLQLLSHNFILEYLFGLHRNFRMEAKFILLQIPLNQVFVMLQFVLDHFLDSLVERFQILFLGV